MDAFLNLEGGIHFVLDRILYCCKSKNQIFNLADGFWRLKIQAKNECFRAEKVLRLKDFYQIRINIGWK